MNVEEIVQKTIEAYTDVLKRENLIKTNIPPAFQKTETLLYNYTKFQDVLNNKRKEIESIEASGITKKSKSVVQFSSGNSINHDNEYEMSLSAIEKIRASIFNIESYMKFIDEALNSIKDDQYFELIELKYFKNHSREYIAEYFDVDASTISRQKNRLINILQIKLFPDEHLREILFK